METQRGQVSRPKCTQSVRTRSRGLGGGPSRCLHRKGSLLCCWEAGGLANSLQLSASSGLPSGPERSLSQERARSGAAHSHWLMEAEVGKPSLVASCGTPWMATLAPEPRRVGWGCRVVRGLLSPSAFLPHFQNCWSQGQYWVNILHTKLHLTECFQESPVLNKT